MQEYQFYSAFGRNHCTKHFFRGTFACDEIAAEEPKPGLYVVNTAPRSSSGEHWTLCFISVEREVSYFDSYGLQPIYPQFYEFIRPTPSFQYSSKRLQGYDSNTCGLYCLYVGSQLSCGVPLQECTSKFSPTKFRLNDRLIATLVQKEFPREKINMTCCSAFEY